MHPLYCGSGRSVSGVFSVTILWESSRTAVKRISIYLNLFVLITTLVIPGFVFAQQRPQNPNSSNLAGSGSTRRNRTASSNGTATVERDFSEALKVIEDQYI